jgi:hypothetical protein
VKTTLTVQGHVCDSCGKQAPYVQTCLKCGAEHCHLCDDTQGVRYSHGVHFGGSGDGYYCKPCDRELLKNGADELHTAFVLVESLRQEEKRFSKDFRRRADEAEAAVKKAQS